MKLSDILPVKKPTFYDLDALTRRNNPPYWSLPKYPYEPASNSYFVGLEIEAENYRGFDLADTANFAYFWRTKEERSLRNHGVEFYSYPIKGELLPYYLGILLYLNKRYNLQYNDLTGMHVHINALDMTEDNVACFVALNVLFEPALFRFSGDRQNSIYCVPIRKSANDLRDFIRFRNDPYSLRDVVANARKYLALNYKTLDMFGTFEYRHMKGTDDVSHIADWIDLIFRIREAANKSFDETIAKIYSLNTTSEYDIFAQDIFKHQFPLIHSTSLGKEMADGVAMLKEWEAQDNGEHLSLVQDEGFHKQRRNLWERPQIVKPIIRPFPIHPEGAAERKDLNRVALAMNRIQGLHADRVVVEEVLQGDNRFVFQGLDRLAAEWAEPNPFAVKVKNNGEV